MTWKLYAVVSAGAFAATYLMSTPQPDQAQATSAAPRTTRQSTDETEIEALADSLRVRLNAETTFRAPGRNPFRFEARAQQAPAVVSPPPVAESTTLPPASAPALPILSLSGIATDVVDGNPQRAAVLSAPTAVLIVREGESVAGLYTVVSIGEDSIELESTTDGSRRTLRLAR